MDGRLRCRRACSPRRRGGEAGQALTETIISLTIVLAVFWGLIHISLLAVTRHVSNYAAFAGARASVYGGAGSSFRGQAAAHQITGTLPRGTQFLWGRAQGRRYRVELLSPFSYALFSSGRGSLVTVASESPLYVQPNIPEAGDNAGR